MKINHKWEKKSLIILQNSNISIWRRPSFTRMRPARLYIGNCWAITANKPRRGSLSLAVSRPSSRSYSCLWPLYTYIACEKSKRACITRHVPKSRGASVSHPAHVTRNFRKSDDDALVAIAKSPRTVPIYFRPRFAIPQFFLFFSLLFGITPPLPVRCWPIEIFFFDIMWKKKCFDKILLAVREIIWWPQSRLQPDFDGLIYYQVTRVKEYFFIFFLLRINDVVLLYTRTRNKHWKIFYSQRQSLLFFGLLYFSPLAAIILLLLAIEQFVSSMVQCVIYTHTQWFFTPSLIYNKIVLVSRDCAHCESKSEILLK